MSATDTPLPLARDATATISVHVTIPAHDLLEGDPAELRAHLGEEVYRTALVKLGAR